MFVASPCSCLCVIYWDQVLSQEWRCSWSSADRRCSNYIWVIDNFIAYQGASYIRDFTVILHIALQQFHMQNIHHTWIHKTHPIARFQGEPWDVYCEYFGEIWACYDLHCILHSNSSWCWGLWQGIISHFDFLFIPFSDKAFWWHFWAYIFIDRSVILRNVSEF